MGTFHQDKHELHGITVVVGRCDDMDDSEIDLHDVAVHKDGQEGRSKAEYVRHAERFECGRSTTSSPFRGTRSHRSGG